MPEIRFVHAGKLTEQERKELLPDFLRLEQEFYRETNVPPLGVLPLPTTLVFEGKKLVGFADHDIIRNKLRITRMHLEKHLRHSIMDEALAARLTQHIIQLASPPKVRGGTIADHWLASLPPIEIVEWNRRGNMVRMPLHELLRLLPPQSSLTSPKPARAPPIGLLKSPFHRSIPVRKANPEFRPNAAGSFTRHPHNRRGK